MKKRMAAIGFLVVGVAVAILLWRMRSNPSYLDRFQVRVLSARPLPDGSVQMTLLLTNGTGILLNVHDDSAGNPAFRLDSPQSGRRYVTDMANRLRLNLASGTCFTNVLVLTNPPPKFRLICSLRDLDAESRCWSAYRFLPHSLAMRILEWRRKEWDLPLRCTDWVELDSLTNSPISQP
jgi:hypothetical protein